MWVPGTAIEHESELDPTIKREKISELVCLPPEFKQKRDSSVWYWLAWQKNSNADEKQR